MEIKILSFMPLLGDFNLLAVPTINRSSKQAFSCFIRVLSKEDNRLAIRNKCQVTT